VTAGSAVSQAHGLRPVPRHRDQSHHRPLSLTLRPTPQPPASAGATPQAHGLRLAPRNRDQPHHRRPTPQPANRRSCITQRPAHRENFA